MLANKKTGQAYGRLCDPDWLTYGIDYQLFMILSIVLSIWWPLPETHVV